MPISSNINPGLWASFKLFLKNPTFDSVMSLFLSQLSQFAAQTLQQLTLLSSASGLAAILNGAFLLNITALNTVSTSLGVVGTNQTVNCAGAVGVTVLAGMSAAVTLNFTNLANSVPVYLRITNNSGGALVLKIAGTNAAGTAFGSVQAVFVSAGAETNMITTGFSVGSGTAQHFQGMAATGTMLNLMGL
jgi:hypothetical protein